MSNLYQIESDHQLELAYANLSEEEKRSLSKDQLDALVFEAFIATCRAVFNLPLNELRGAQ